MAQAWNEAEADRIVGRGEDDRDFRRCLLRRQRRWCTARSEDRRDTHVHELGGKLRQAVVTPFGPTIFDCDVPPGDKAGFGKALAERRDDSLGFARRTAAQEANEWNRRLL